MYLYVSPVGLAGGRGETYESMSPAAEADGVRRT
jgi:hypothetical protein